MSRQQPKYSFVIPIYNAQDYLRRCLDSILCQRYDAWEAILVDDGSCDRSLEIAREYLGKDSRFVVLTQNNQGCGLARNTAMEAACGEWMAFVDADDCISKDYLEEIEKVSNDKDIVFFGAARVDLKDNILRTYHQHRFKDLSLDELIRVQLTGKMEWGAWIKCVRTSLVKENSILFPKSKNAEDAVFTFKVMSMEPTYVFIPKVLYFYVDHGLSLSSEPLLDPWGDAVGLIKEYAQDSSLYNRYGSTINALRLTTAVVSIDRISRYASRLDRGELISAVMRSLKSDLDLSYGIDTMHMMLKAKIFVPFLLRGISWPVILISVLRKALRGK